MKMYDSNKILVSLHIPKCGGTSFESVLRKWFGLGLHKHYANHKYRFPPKFPYLKAKYQHYMPLCVHGHFDKHIDGIGVFDYYPAASQFISIYRDPIEIQSSFYFYTKELAKVSASWKGEIIKSDWLGESLDEHLEKFNMNWLRFIPWELTSDNFKKVIDENFLHFGITENIEKSIEILADILKKRPYKLPNKNVTKRSEKASESAIKKFKENHILEYQVYDYLISKNK